MTDAATAREYLVAGLTRTLHRLSNDDNHTMMPPQQRTRRRRRGGLIHNPFDDSPRITTVTALIDQELPDWANRVRDLAAHNDYPVSNLLTVHRPTCDLAHLLVHLFDDGADRGNIAATVERLVGYLTGPANPLWDYVVVDVRIHAPVDMHGGWQLRPANPADDATLPLAFPSLFGQPGDLGILHSSGCAVLRRPVPSAGHRISAGPDQRDITLPVLTLNLAGSQRIRALWAYRVEPGREVADQPGVPIMGSSYIPGEVRYWEPHPKSLHARKVTALQVDPARLARFAAALGRRVDQLSTKRRERLWRAADRLITVAYHVISGLNADCGSRPSMRTSKAAAEWSAAVEALFVPDGKTGDNTRKFAQRLAVALGCDDERRLAVYDVARTMYAVRSSQVHVGTDAETDVRPLRTMAHDAFTAWIVLAADNDDTALITMLDRALLSGELLRTQIRRPIEQFWSEVA